jgi:palmitoyltransferase
MLFSLAAHFFGRFGTHIILSFYSVIIALLIHCVFFSNPQSKSLNGSISRFLYETLPEKFAIRLISLFGEKGYEKIFSCYEYVAFERNPIMQIVYLVALNGCFICWLMYGEPKLPTVLLGLHHKYIAIAGVFLCHYSFYKACTVSPGYVTKENYKCFMHTPYDNLLFIAGYGCATCEVHKVS